MPVATLTAEFERLIQFGPASFSYYLRIREDAATLHRLLADLGADRFILITDKKAPPRQVARVHSRLAEPHFCARCARLALSLGLTQWIFALSEGLVGYSASDYDAIAQLRW